MSTSDEFFNRVSGLLNKIETLLPGTPELPDLNSYQAFRWQHQGLGRSILPIESISNITLSDLKCIDRQKIAIERNTRQFLKGLPANHVLLWGPRGTGKSSLIKALMNEFREDNLKFIEVERQHLVDLPEIVQTLGKEDMRFIIFCDDLSFEADDPSYKAMKVVIDGSIASTPDNILIYATSNRRHLMPEYMSDNENSKMIDDELHLSESVEEKISLSERFGLWQAFHPFNQDEYLLIVDYWLGKLNAPLPDIKIIHKAALKWALEHGSRSGRSAHQFARDWTGRHLLNDS